MRLYQSWLFVPGNQQRMLDKALGLDLDAAIFDLEDGVAPGEKGEARRRVREVLGRPRTAVAPSRFVRVHAPGSEAFLADLDAIFGPGGLDGVVLAKVTRPEDLLEAGAAIREHEATSGISPESTPLVAIIESARGLLNLREISASSPRLAALMFGAEDFSRDLGLPLEREAEAADLLYARSAVAVAAAAGGLQAIDQVWPKLGDHAGMRADTLTGRRLGFTGKACIHPEQVDAVHAVMRPTDAEVEFARRVDEAFRAAEAAGRGAIAVDGRLVDQPVVERARQLLEHHRASGRRGKRAD